MMFVRKRFLFADGILLLAILTHSVIRDVMYDKQYPCDLRNRIVGARLQKDGKLPYHYHWQESDGIRYYDSGDWLRVSEKNQNGDTFNAGTPVANINKITASPFFHELLYPVCDLPQRTLSRLWLWGEYVMLLSMILMLCSLTNDKATKWLIINVGILFTLTEAWKCNISTGQLYLFEGFLMCCILTTLIRNKKYGAVVAGILTTMFVLTRPVAAVFFIPFLMSYKKYKIFISTALIGLAGYALFIFLSPKETALYKDYLMAMKTHIVLHQRAIDFPPSSSSSSDALEILKFPNIEGFDVAEVNRLTRQNPNEVRTENGNLFVIYNKIFQRKISLELLNAASVFTVFFLSLLFFLKKRIYVASTLQILIFGFTLYLIVELFSPVHRHQYNTVQWFPLVLASFLLITEWKNIVLKMMIAGLILNIFNFTWLPMRHTIGEYLWMLGLLIAAFSFQEAGITKERHVPTPAEATT